MTYNIIIQTRRIKVKINKIAILSKYWITFNSISGYKQLFKKIFRSYFLIQKSTNIE